MFTGSDISVPSVKSNFEITTQRYFIVREADCTVKHCYFVVLYAVGWFWYNTVMIEKVVQKHKLQDYDEVRANLKYGLSRPASERVDAVEFYRRQVYGSLPRLQRVVRAIKRSTGRKKDLADLEALDE